MLFSSLYSPARTAIAAGVLLCAGAVQAAPVIWTITGPGTTAATQTGNDAALSYNHPGANFATDTWQVRGVATTAGDYNFDWDYTGFHSFFRVTAFLTTTDGDTLVNAGPSNCCTAPSNGFSYIGSHTFSGVAAGSTIGFNMGGSHFDSANAKSGTLRLTQIPEPTSLALVSLALLGGAALTRRKA